MQNQTCPKCDGEMDAGTVRGETSLIYTSKAQQGFFKLGTLIDQARVCLSCGYVELYVDPEVLKKKLQP